MILIKDHCTSRWCASLQIYTFMGSNTYFGFVYLLLWSQIISDLEASAVSKHQTSWVSVVDTAVYLKYVSQDAALYNPAKYSMLLHHHGNQNPASTWALIIFMTLFKAISNTSLLL